MSIYNRNTRQGARFSVTSVTEQSKKDTVTVELSPAELIIFHIQNNKLSDLKGLVDTNNVNNIIDSKSGYRALDYAIRNDNSDVIDFLLKLGADPYLLNASQKNAFEMSRIYMNNNVVLFSLKSKDDEIDSHKKTITTLEKSVSNLEACKAYMTKSIDTLNNDTSVFKNQISTLKGESSNLKTDVYNLSVKTRSMTAKIEAYQRDTTDLRANNNFLKSTVANLRNENDELKKENTSLKRKYSDLETSYENLFKSTRKNS
jgi:FtsZ-binding cell division protein ZapB